MNASRLKIFSHCSVIVPISDLGAGVNPKIVNCKVGIHTLNTLICTQMQFRFKIQISCMLLVWRRKPEPAPQTPPHPKKTKNLQLAYKSNHRLQKKSLK